jgi:hypothetical protein
MGLKRYLYIVNFEFIESLDFNIGRSMCRRLFNNSRLDFRCGPHVNLLSIMIPRYFISAVIGILKTCSWRDGEFFLSVNGTWNDFSSFFWMVFYVKPTLLLWYLLVIQKIQFKRYENKTIFKINFTGFFQMRDPKFKQKARGPVTPPQIWL